MTEMQQAAANLNHADLAIRVAAAEKLAAAGSDAAVAAVELVRACRDDATVQTWAVAALEDLGPPPAATLDELLKLAKASQPLVTYWAVTLIGRLGADAAAAEETLAAVLQQASDLATRERAAWALGQIAAKSAVCVAALEQASQAKEPRLARLARESLQQVRT